MFTLTCPAGTYAADSLLALAWEVLKHRAWHFSRGDGFVD